MQGTVTDASTQAGIVGAQVTLVTAGKGFFKGGSAITTTTSSGQYTFDSSQFNESAATGFDVSNVLAFGWQVIPVTKGFGFPRCPPFPVTQNLQVNSDGTLWQHNCCD